MVDVMTLPELAATLLVLPIAASWDRTANDDLRDRSEDGIRYVDLRLSYEPDGQIYIEHGRRGLEFGDLRNDIAQFSSNDPERLVGSDSRDYLFGFGGNDKLLGRSGSDWIWGGGMDDRIIGQGGADLLVGGRGNDFFEYRSFDESHKGSRDVILDFSSHDKIDLTALRPNDAKFVYIGDASFREYSETHPGEEYLIRIDTEKQLLKAMGAGSGPVLSIEIIDMPRHFGADDILL
jgi:hypothetical protein